MDLDLSTRHDQDRAVVTVGGEVDLETAPQLGDHVLAALQDVSPHVVLDLTGVTFMDSTGLKVLLSIQRRADLAGGSFALAGVGRTVAKVLALTGLDQTFAIYDTLADVPQPAGAGPRPRRSAATQRPRPDQVDPRLQLLGGRLRGQRSAAGLPQLGVHGAVRDPGAVVPGRRPAR